MNCIFCHTRSGGSALTKEHVFSKPVRRTFGILDDSYIGRIDEERSVSSFPRADQFQVKLPCSPCNNGWMASLETEFAQFVAAWRRDGDRLGKRRERTIRRWLLKTYIVLSAVEGNVRDIGAIDETPPWRVMPEATRARQLLEDDDAAFAGVRFGASLVLSSKYLYGFGNPTIESPHGGLTPHISAGVCFVTLDGLRLWIVVAFDHDATIHLPRGVSRLNPHLRTCRLSHVGQRADLANTRVLNSPRFDQMARALDDLT